MARARDHKPRDKKGEALCWNFSAHKGCATPCPFKMSHDEQIDFETCDHSIQLALLKRGGPKIRKKCPDEQLISHMGKIRKEQSDKFKQNMEEGKKLKVGANPTPAPSIETTALLAQLEKLQTSVDAVERKVGADPKTRFAPPAAFTSVQLTEGESELHQVLQGPDNSWFDNHHEGTATLPVPDPLPAPYRERAKLMEQVDSFGLLDWGDLKSTLLGTWLKNRLLQLMEANTVVNRSHVDDLLQEAVEKGSPELAAQADSLLAHQRVPRKAGGRVEIPELEWNEGVGQGPVIWNSQSWTRLDFGDTLEVHQSLKDLLADPQNVDPNESHQCLPIHVAAGLLLHQQKQIPSMDAVHRKAQELRISLAAQAAEALTVLGPLPDELTQAEADLRVFAHDAVHFAHDKDYRALAAFPLQDFSELCVNVLRVSDTMHPTVESVCGARHEGSKPSKSGFLFILGICSFWCHQNQREPCHQRERSKSQPPDGKPILKPPLGRTR